MGPVDWFSGRYNLQEENAECEDVRLFVHYAVHEVLGSEVSARFHHDDEDDDDCKDDGEDEPQGSLDGADGSVGPFGGEPSRQPEVGDLWVMQERPEHKDRHHGMHNLIHLTDSVT